MNDTKRAALLKSAIADLHKTEHGYKPTNGGGPNWTNATRKLNQLYNDLASAGPSLVFPIAAGSEPVFVGGLHQTGGLGGNWALDFICKAGLGIVAPERARVTRFSGHDPSDDQSDALGVYGWTTYLQTPDGYTYFCTHQGRRYPTLRVGMNVQAGDLLGFVGDQRYRPDHLHLGVTSPKGQVDAKARILAVSRAPRVT